MRERIKPSHTYSTGADFQGWLECELTKKNVFPPTEMKVYVALIFNLIVLQVCVCVWKIDVSIHLNDITQASLSWSHAIVKDVFSYF